MGGLGRTINGSYAEYTRAPVSNVAAHRVGPAVGRAGGHPRDLCYRLDLPVPQPGDRQGQMLVIRGATSSFGQAALKMAVNAGARVIATTPQP